jgi:daunorubicin resistance ABC transporter membrane protein
MSGRAELVDEPAARERSPAHSAPVRPPSALAEEFATIRVLVQRDLVRFFREKTRVIGALAQPLIFWLVIGSGMSSTFRLPGSAQVDYLEYFYPGVLVMVVLFSAIFTTMSVIEDRHSGFLQAVLVAPGSRVSVVLGKCLGSSAVALAQGSLFLLLAPLAGFSFANFAWLPLILSLVLTCLALCSAGFAVAWWLDSTSGYHVVMSLLLLPLWILSGAMFPSRSNGVLAAITAGNPMSYAVAAVRRGLYGGALPGSVLAWAHPLTELLVLGSFAFVTVVLAVRVCQKRR